MSPVRAAVAIVLAVLASAATAWSDTGMDHVKVDLLADAPAVHPGGRFTLGVRFRIDPGWHIYWTNPGDSGLPTRVKLDLPRGLTAGATQYPVPSVLTFPGDITNYGYENEVVLLVPVTVDAAVPAPVRLTAHADYLVCQDRCLPGRATVSLDLPAANGDTIERWVARLPRTADEHLDAYQQMTPHEATGGSVHEWVTVHWTSTPPSVNWIPSALDGFEVDDLKVATSGATTQVSFDVRRVDPKAELPASLPGLLTYAGPRGTPVGISLELKYLAPSGVPPAPGSVPGR
jgi:DsbC/DsbD-like thiol-disulfide interchange protein